MRRSPVHGLGRTNCHGAGTPNAVKSRLLYSAMVRVRTQLFNTFKPTVIATTDCGDFFALVASKR
jgi:hypothetical protein